MEAMAPLRKASVRFAIFTCAVAGALGLSSVAQAANPTTSQLSKRTGLSGQEVKQAQAALDRGIAKMRRQVKVVWKGGRPTLRGPARYLRPHHFELRLLPRGARSANTASASATAIQENCRSGTRFDDSPVSQGWPWYQSQFGYYEQCTGGYNGYRWPNVSMIVSAHNSCADIGSPRCQAFPFSNPNYEIAGGTAPPSNYNSGSAFAWDWWYINGGNSKLACSGPYNVCDIWSSGAFQLVAGGSVTVAPPGYYFDPAWLPSYDNRDHGCQLQRLDTWEVCLGVNGTVVTVDDGYVTPNFYGIDLRDYPWIEGYFNTAGTG